MPVGLADSTSKSATADEVCACSWSYSTLAKGVGCFSNTPGTASRWAIGITHRDLPKIETLCHAKDIICLSKIQQPLQSSNTCQNDALQPTNRLNCQIQQGPLDLLQLMFAKKKQPSRGQLQKLKQISYCLISRRTMDPRVSSAMSWMMYVAMPSWSLYLFLTAIAVFICTWVESQH